MIIWDDAITTMQNLTDDTTQDTMLKLMANVGYKFILAELARTVTEKTKTASTVEDQQFYQMPPDFLWLKDLTVTVGSTTYPTTEIVDQEEWNYLNQTSQSSDIPTFIFVRPYWGVSGAEIGIFPIPASTATVTFTVSSADATAAATYTNNSQTFTVVTTIDGGTTLVCTFTGYPASSGTLTKASGTGDATITFTAVSYSGIINIVYEAGDKDLSVAAYTTGTVTMVNGDDDVTGDSTVWTAAMVGRYFTITTAGGDGQWYKIASRSANTAIKLENYYDGVSGSSLAYKIAEAFALPEEMQILPIYYALAHYFAMKKDQNQETTYLTLFNAGIIQAKRRYGTKSRSNIIKRNPWRVGGGGYPSYFPQAGISS